jgi:hypothetical protein
MATETNSLSKYTVSFGLALAIASVVNAMLVIVKEKSPRVMEGMKGLTGHHWVTHSLVVILLFLGLGWGLAQGGGKRMASRALLGWLFGGVVIGAGLIVGFYLLGD